ncbi:similar to Saccharomyces cerevisiae YJL184W GON7 Component of the EKC/KEOPS protein complex with Kae1p, Cgi121p, Pcc1p, and Bud32p [Maudiozyma barnettii]|uniref:EKC/KEOPS complex subunit GON7 n=1 Tax=Maudiozyma barnettii TaxID=61262 RepID=A0A8H2VFP0_9SACH|nr:chromatin DNA-binding EKC/KEOPS complex subunit GON7 [Kazachstania barnettii]CAB4254705.1 similar to Saccharomyces cerevisiae YJL184W GON7 Component of the EKC/KEOPS protein complex with Kae1p, Cgi121p, Pcc1p, and Bud32p [Kazachstania barnettii]CAD1782747.1 similar to Saccharomyces cerevisiae YJL184W GON7 Component of the EKC/KEOPS protein complex with Kae1p, Cgi121p, Pcc1p, and Bud32p [Kazachstania barnettii]
MTSPLATYSSPDITEKLFAVKEGNSRYSTTNGKTTGPSTYVLNAGQVDIDKPSDPRINPATQQPTTLSKLRMELTGMQDDINEFLTQRMEVAKNKKLKIQNTSEEKRIENEINELLDGGDGDDDEDAEDQKEKNTNAK